MRSDRYAAAFVTPDGQVEEHLSKHPWTVDLLGRLARDLGSRFFVVIDGEDIENKQPIWAVFDMRTASPNGGGPRVWSIRDPVKTFPGNYDAAVMWAVHQATT